MKSMSIKQILAAAAMTTVLGMTAGGADAFNQVHLDTLKSTGVCNKFCDLSNSVLKGVTIKDVGTARMTSSNLVGVLIASGVVLNGTNLMSANLTNVNLSSAVMNSSTNFASANLTGVTPPAKGWNLANLTGATWIDGVKKCGANSYGVCK